MAEKLIRVIGAAVVLPLAGGSERYLYRNAIAPTKAFTPEGVEHAKSIGLIEDFVEPEPEPETGEEKTVDPYKGKSVDDLKAELASRNEGRADEDKIVPAEPGNKPEVLAALKADDDKQAAKAAEQQ